MKMITIFALIGFSFIASAIGLTIGPFENVTDGIWDEWQNLNPENVKHDRFGMEYEHDRLYLVSKRQFRQNFEDPWDPASRGGVVSSLRLSSRNWTHKSYDRLAEDHYGDKLFSLNGRLFMLTYSNKQRKIAYHKLFFWEYENGRWLETPFDIDQSAGTQLAYSITQLAITVPDQKGRLAYAVASAHAYANRGSEMVYSKLDIQFRGSVPVKGTLKLITRVLDDEPSGVFFIAQRNQTLYALVQNMYSEGYVSEVSYAFTLDLNTNNVSKVKLTGDAPPMNYEEERIFQTKDELFIVGGYQVVGLGGLNQVNDIWVLNLDTLQWYSSNATIPKGSGTVPAYDQQNAKLYLAGLREGIKVASVHK